MSKGKNPANRKRGAWSNFRKEYLKDREQWGGYYVCEWCGVWKKKDEIDLDHIHTRGSRPDLVYDESNLRLLCRNCHIKRHQMV